MQDEREDIWEQDASKSMWQVVLDVWLKHAIELDTPIADLHHMFTPLNCVAGAQHYSQNAYTRGWHVVGNDEFDIHVGARHEAMLQIHQDLQSNLHNVCVFDKNELVDTVENGDPILTGVMNKAYELKIKSERLYRVNTEVVNVAAGQASVIQAQRDYALRKYFDEFQNCSRLEDKNTELEFDRQTVKAYAKRKFKDKCGAWKGKLEHALSQANLETAQAHQENVELHDENSRLHGMYRGMREHGTLTSNERSQQAEQDHRYA